MCAYEHHLYAGACRGQKKSELLERELQKVVSLQVLGTELVPLQEDQAIFYIIFPASINVYF